MDTESTPIMSNEDTQITLAMSDKGTQITLAMSKKGTQPDPIPTATPKPPIPKHNPNPFISPTINTSEPIIHLTSNNTSFVSAHMGLLTRNSAYFSEFFAPGLLHSKKYRYGPASTRTVISFKDCCWAHEPHKFVLQIYTEWLYNGKLDRLLMTDEIFEDLVGLYVFGKQVLDAVFCNAVMDLFTRLHGCKRCLVRGDVVAMVYGMTSKGSKLREVVADVYAYNVVEDVSELREFVEEMPKEFLVDVVVKMASVREEKSGELWVRLVEEGYYME